MSEIKSNVFYCTICQYPEEALPNAYRVRPYVHEIIVVHNQHVIEQVKAEFDDLKATLHFVDWKEDFSYKRTQYIRKTGDIIKEKGSRSSGDNACGYTKNNTWMLISDTDEFPSIALLQNLQSIIAKAEIEKSTICTINAHDYLIRGEGTSDPFTFIPKPLEDVTQEEIVGHTISNYHKELLVKYQDKLEYTGKVHHTLRGSGLRMMQAQKEYYYDHIKKDADMHSHGCRNWFIGGGGVQEFGPKWKELRKITDKYGLDSWEKMEKAMKNGNIQSDIKQFFVDHKDDNDTSSDSEVRSFYTYYNMLHKEELKGILQNVKSVVTKDGIKDPIPTGIKKSESLYYDPNWKREPAKKVVVENPKKVIDTYMNDYKYQETKVSSNSSNSPKLESYRPRSKEPFPSEKVLTNEAELDGLKNKEEIEEFVDDTYIQILGRSADEGGLKTYTSAIMEGRINKKQLADIFRKSDEYIEKGFDT